MSEWQPTETAPSGVDVLVDSKEGIETLLNWARDNVFVPSERHKMIAIKYGVPIDGVVFSTKIPTR